MTKRPHEDGTTLLPVEERDAVSWLQRHAHIMKWDLPNYSEKERCGQAHDPTFKYRVTVGPVSVEATGSNKKLAKQNAARAAMEAVKGQGAVLQPDVKAAKIRSHLQNLHELVQRQGWTVDFPTSQVGPSEFVCSVIVNGKLVAEEAGATRRNARENASERANQTLRQEPTQQEFALRVVDLAMAQFRELTEHIKVAPSSCVACFLMESREGMQVVAMGSGTGYFCDAFAPLDSERELLLDGHAEVLARRSLLRFLYAELEVARSHEQEPEPHTTNDAHGAHQQQQQRRRRRGGAGRRDGGSLLFEPRSPSARAQGGPFALRSDVLFHLYVSVLPCGDAKMFSSNDSHFLRPLQGIFCRNGCGHALPAHGDVNGHWPSMGRKSEGLLRARLDTGESYSPLPSVVPLPDGNNGSNARIRKVTCSDKILQWNVLGVQGAFLSSLIKDPIYIKSVVIGGKTFSHGAVSRAFCCRAQDVEPKLRPPYRLNHPMLFHVSDEEVAGQQMPAGHGGQKLSSVAWCWCEGDKEPEVIDCRTGRPMHALLPAGITKGKSKVVHAEMPVFPPSSPRPPLALAASPLPPPPDLLLGFEAGTAGARAGCDSPEAGEGCDKEEEDDQEEEEEPGRAESKTRKVLSVAAFSVEEEQESMPSTSSTTTTTTTSTSGGSNPALGACAGAAQQSMEQQQQQQQQVTVEDHVSQLNLCMQVNAWPLPVYQVSLRAAAVPAEGADHPAGGGKLVPGSLALNLAGDAGDGCQGPGLGSPPNPSQSTLHDSFVPAASELPQLQPPPPSSLPIPSVDALALESGALGGCGGGGSEKTAHDEDVFNEDEIIVLAAPVCSPTQPPVPNGTGGDDGGGEQIEEEIVLGVPNGGPSPGTPGAQPGGSVQPPVLVNAAATVPATVPATGEAAAAGSESGGGVSPSSAAVAAAAAAVSGTSISSSSTSRTGERKRKKGGGGGCGASGDGQRWYLTVVTCHIRGVPRVARGEGPSKKRSKQAAAQAMLKALTSLLGPVLAHPVAAVAGASLLLRFRALVRALKGGALKGGALKGGGIGALWTGGGNSSSSSGGGGGGGIPVGAAIADSSGGAKNDANLSYRETKEACSTLYSENKAIFRAFVMTPREQITATSTSSGGGGAAADSATTAGGQQPLKSSGYGGSASQSGPVGAVGGGGGMGQHWLSRRGKNPLDTGMNVLAQTVASKDEERAGPLLLEPPSAS